MSEFVAMRNLQLSIHDLKIKGQEVPYGLIQLFLGLLRPKCFPHLRPNHIHPPRRLNHRPPPAPIWQFRDNIRAFRRRRHNVLQIDDHAQRVTERFQGEADIVDGGHAAVLAAADQRQRVGGFDPHSGLRASQRTHGGAGGS
ncbi:hypothetical protein [Rhodanobacter ginsengiterrae]|uniref:hypothetical protein n=1 Tax=Rhodanobacter ginsengiterrae TaxID=2008451 RepID=UPI003CE7D418